jgi:hypothetical protein
MDIQENWKQLQEGYDKDLSALLQPGSIEKLKSSNPLIKIKRNLLASMIWAMLISILYLYVLVRFPYRQIVISIGIILIFTMWGFVSSYLQYKNIKTEVAGRLPLLAEMEKQYKSIQRWMKIQLKFAVFAYPAGAIGGFLVGIMAGSGKGIQHVEAMLNKPAVILTLLVLIAVIVPCGLYLGKWLLDKSYGTHLLKLKHNIEALKEEK